MQKIKQNTIGIASLISQIHTYLDIQYHKHVTEHIYTVYTAPSKFSANVNLPKYRLKQKICPKI